jgi:2-polyprenyl-6-methoxyphenol hydroxylase-like FAD-dependent oxidoreductase
MKESYVDVLIIGAGPAGVMAANGFARAGVNVRVIDKRYEQTVAHSCVVLTVIPQTSTGGGWSGRWNTAQDD